MWKIRLMQLLRKTVLYSAGFVAGLIMIYAVVNLGLMAVDERRAPYSSILKTIAWQLSWQERAFNFAPVVEDRLYRSAEPSVRFLEYLNRNYGIKRLVTLNGRRDWATHGRAHDLGMQVHVFDWTSKAVPPRRELEQVLALLEEPGPTLVHCAAGKDRTGFAIAAYRLQQGWTLEQAFAEMEERWHDPDKRPWFQHWLRQHRALLEAG